MVDFLVETSAAGAHDDLLVPVGAIVVSGHSLLDGNRQHTLASKQRRVGIFFNPPLFLRFADQAVQVAKAQHHPLILRIAVMLHAARVVIVTPLPQLAYHVHGGIVLLAVLFLALAHNKFLEFNASGYHVDEHHAPLPCFDSHFAWSIAHG